MWLPLFACWAQSLRPAEHPCSLLLQGLLEKQPSLRLDWPQLLDHPFLAETAAEKERQAREAALLEAQKAEAEAAPTLQSRVQGGVADDASGALLLACCQPICWSGVVACLIAALVICYFSGRISKSTGRIPAVQVHSRRRP